MQRVWGTLKYYWKVKHGTMEVIEIKVKDHKFLDNTSHEDQ
jgi:hypothetical protein